jgi:HicB family
VDITGYVEHLRADLHDAAASGGEAMVDAADRLASTLDAAVRMALLEALSDAAAEITAALDGPSVEVRLKGRDPDFVVTSGVPSEPTFPPPPPPPAGIDGGSDEDASTARITLRLPEPLKQRAETAAAAARQSLNTWLVDAVRTAADGRSPTDRPARRAGKQLSGWAR